MKKKIAITIVIIATMSLLVNCNMLSQEKIKKKSEEIHSSYFGFDTRMGIISEGKYGWIVYDKETNVEYWASNYGQLTVLVDEDGKPLLFNVETSMNSE